MITRITKEKLRTQVKPSNWSSDAGTYFLFCSIYCLSLIFWGLKHDKQTKSNGREGKKNKRKNQGFLVGRVPFADFYFWNMVDDTQWIQQCSSKDSIEASSIMPDHQRLMCISSVALADSHSWITVDVANDIMRNGDETRLVLNILLKPQPSTTT